MAKKRYAQDELLGPSPKPPSLLEQAGGLGMSGLSAVGNLLDVPGSMVRDTVMGKNPFDQLLTPFHETHRTTGRELNRSLGLAGHKDTYGNWWGGLGTEIATDPLTYLSLGGAALGKGVGRIAAKAGVHGLEASRIATAASKGGRLAGLGSWVGPREARLTLTPQHIKDFAPEVFERLASTAKNQPGGAFDLLNHMDEPLGALAKVWPLGDAGLIGKGKTAQKIARGLDVAGDAVRNFRIPGTSVRPIADVANLVNRKAGGAVNAEQMQAAYHNFAEKERSRYQVNQLANKWTNDVIRAGHKDTDAFQMRGWLEKGGEPQELKPIFDEMRDFVKQIPHLSDAVGAGIENVNKKIQKEGGTFEYFMRSMAKGLKQGAGSGGKSFDPYTPAKEMRYAWSHQSKNGSQVITDMARDPTLKPLLDTGDIQNAAQYIKATYGHVLPSPTFKVKVGGRVRTRDTYEAAAKSLSKLSPELRASGIYANHPIVDFVTSAVGSMEKIRSAEVALQHIAENMSNTFQPGMVPVRQVIKDIGLKVGKKDKAGNFINGAFGFLGQSGVGGFVPKETADFLRQNYTRLKGGPEHLHPMIKFFDDIANITKAAFTNLDPIRFNVRNRASGAAANALAGLDQVAHGAAWDADKLIKGQTIEGAAQLPFMAEEAAKRGIQNLDDARATEMLREILGAREVTGSYGVANMPTHGNVAPGAGLEDILHSMPGGHPFSWKDVGQKAIGQKGTTWNPLKGKWRGVFGSNESTFAPLAAGEDISYWTESMNRIAPMLALMKHGVHPDEAIQRVLKSQVGYQGRFYTPFEQQVLKRLFLFYSFSKGMVPFTLQQLAEKPGGPLAQVLRTINKGGGEDELVPQHVAETAHIPVGDIPGMEPLEQGAKRYITGFGMGFEDPAQFAVPSIQNLGMEALSRTNPLIKGPLEAVLGQSFFQRAPGGGGRSLEDLDPVLGRTLANIGEITGLRPNNKAPVKYPGSQVLEHVISNSPLSNLATKARTITDVRKGPVAKAINLLTGVKATDVSPGAQDKELLSRIGQIEKKMGGKTYIDTYVPKDTKAQMTPQELQAYMQIQALRQLLEERSKERKKK